MDQRYIHTHAFDNPSDEELERPPMCRYWRTLPPNGRIGMLFGSWYTTPIIDRVFKRTRAKDMLAAIDEINHLERMLADEGALILKFWFHLSKKAQRKRLKELEADPETSWKISKRDWDFFKMYDRFNRISEKVLRETSTGQAPWLVVEGADPQYRSITVGRTLLVAMQKRLNRNGDKKPRVTQTAPLVTPVDNLHILDKMDLSLTLPKKKYSAEVKKLQGRLARLVRHPGFRKHSVVCVFEGMDAAGKGGAIRRIAAALDARLYRIIPIAAPSDEEKAKPYLWRFWRYLPRKGHLVIYDRSWYGRVLVERIEGFCSESDWMRAYSEIYDFEEQIVAHGGIMCKFWLQISKDEQLKRFKEREVTRFKQFKITEEDWRNREKWNEYQKAAADIIERTSTSLAPWTLVSANDKNYARVTILQTLAKAIEKAL